MPLSSKEKRKLFIKALRDANTRANRLEEILKDYSDDDLNDLGASEQDLLERIMREENLSKTEELMQSLNLTKIDLERLSRLLGIQLPEKDMSDYLGSEEGPANPYLNQPIEGLEPDRDFYIDKLGLKDLVKENPEEELGARLFSRVPSDANELLSDKATDLDEGDIAEASESNLENKADKSAKKNGLALKDKEMAILKLIQSAMPLNGGLDYDKANHDDHEKSLDISPDPNRDIVGSKKKN